MQNLVKITLVAVAMMLSAQNVFAAVSTKQLAGSWLVHRDIGCNGSYDFSFRVELSPKDAWGSEGWKWGQSRESATPLYWSVSKNEVTMSWTSPVAPGEASLAYFGTVVNNNEMVAIEVDRGVEQNNCVKILRFKKGKCNFLPDRASCQVEQTAP